MNEQLQYWVAFNNVPGIGRVRTANLEQYFGSLEEAWHAPIGEIGKSGLDSAGVKAIARYRPGISPEAELEKLHNKNVTAITCHDKAYPARLKEIYDYPPVLYVRGEIKPEDEWSVAVVGTRRITVYGRQVTAELTSDLAANGITVVSGLARGVDTIAHRSALEAGGRTIAVLGLS